MKKCRICLVEKDLVEFQTCGKYKASYCKLCQKTFIKEWSTKNWEDIKRKRARKYKNMTFEEKRRTKLINRYGIDLVKYNQILHDQKGVCKICLNTCKNKAYLSVDHCHKTKQIRGLLCDNCNNILGRSFDNPNILRRAADYLEFFQQTIQKIGV